jgi:hypothetical protein
VKRLLDMKERYNILRNKVENASQKENTRRKKWSKQVTEKSNSLNYGRRIK